MSQEIIDPVRILTVAQMEAENLILENIVLRTTTMDEAIEFLVERRLLANTSTCDVGKRTRGIDGKLWVCRGCRSEKSR